MEDMGGQFRHLLLGVCIAASIFEFYKPTMIDEYMYLIFLFGLWMVYAISGDWKWLSNKAVKYLSGISMEIYLSHMVLFRMTEKLGVDSLSDSPNVNYVVATVFTLAMTICFCHIVKYKVLPIMMNLMHKH